MYTDGQTERNKQCFTAFCWNALKRSLAETLAVTIVDLHRTFRGIFAFFFETQIDEEKPCFHIPFGVWIFKSLPLIQKYLDIILLKCISVIRSSYVLQIQHSLHLDFKLNVNSDLSANKRQNQVRKRTPLWGVKKLAVLNWVWVTKKKINVPNLMPSRNLNMFKTFLKKNVSIIQHHQFIVTIINNNNL